METTITRVDFEGYLKRALEGEARGLALSRGRSSREQGAHRTSFTGTASWAEAASLATEGWAEGREMVGKILSEIEVKTQEITRPACVWDVTGDFVDVGAYVSGEPECMVRWEEQEQPKRVVRIMANISASCGVSTDALRWKGACVLALIDKLESSGVRVELDMAYAVKGHASLWIMVANVKRADEPLHIDRLAFHLAHPSSLRRLWFSFAECAEPKLIREHAMYAGGYYGFPVTDIGPELEAAGEKYELVVPGFFWTDLERAVREVEAMFGQVCDVATTRV